jgi:hypothetical protein
VLGKDYRTTTATNAPGANQLALIPVTYPVNATLDNVSLVPGATSAGAKFKAVLYSDSAGAPNALVATGTEVTGATSGTTLTLPFSSGQALTGGTQYWIGYITDTSVALQRFDSTSTTGRIKSNTYASGAPNPAGSMTTGQAVWRLWGTLSSVASNYATVARGEPTTLSYNSEATVNDEDLVGFPSMATTPAQVHMVTMCVAALKTDAGARTMKVRAKSGSTTSNGSNSGHALAVGTAYLRSNYYTDPDTSSAWGSSGANGVKGGYEIAS